MDKLCPDKDLIRNLSFIGTRHVVTKEEEKEKGRGEKVHIKASPCDPIPLHVSQPLKCQMDSNIINNLTEISRQFFCVLRRALSKTP
jgi:hypothetical protein